jgi:cytochrome P450
VSIHKRVEKLEALEGQTRQDLQPDEAGFARSKARARMKEYLDEIAAARREGRAPAPWAEAIGEAIKRRQACESA